MTTKDLKIVLNDLYDDISSQTGTFGIDESNAIDWITLNQNHVSTLIQTLHTKLPISQTHKSTSTLSPIRRSNITLESRSSNIINSYQKVLVHQNWPEKLRNKVILLWLTYGEDREGMIYDYVNLWNEERNHYITQSNLIPFFDCTLTELDQKIKQYIYKKDQFLNMVLIQAMMKVLGFSMTCKQVQMIGNLLNGYSDSYCQSTFKDQKPTSIVIQQRLEEYFNQLNINQQISKLDKLKLMKETGLSLEELNDCNSQLQSGLESQMTHDVLEPLPDLFDGTHLQLPEFNINHLLESMYQ
ncbi:hypothetical protein HDV02_001215 [Globomyces sp. JEL0801]|nr:hypothetical protein HDV02_001215 [Globomyces sp. JEL0801]